MSHPDDLYKTIIDITNRSSIGISDFMRNAIELKIIAQGFAETDNPIPNTHRGGTKDV